MLSITLIEFELIEIRKISHWPVNLENGEVSPLNDMKYAINRG